MKKKRKTGGDRGQDKVMPYKASRPDGVYRVCLQKGLDITIKYLTEEFRDSLAMCHISIPRKDVRVVLIHKPGKEPNLARSYHLRSF